MSVQAAKNIPEPTKWFNNGKFTGNVPGGPQDLTPNMAYTTQDHRHCAAGKLCMAKMVPMKPNNRCPGCGFHHHIVCGLELKSTKRRSVADTPFKSICKGCINMRNFDPILQRNRQGKVEGLALHRNVVHGLTTLEWSKIKLVQVKSKKRTSLSTASLTSDSEASTTVPSDDPQNSQSSDDEILQDVDMSEPNETTLGQLSEDSQDDDSPPPLRNKSNYDSDSDDEEDDDNDDVDDDDDNRNNHDKQDEEIESFESNDKSDNDMDIEDNNEVEIVSPPRKSTNNNRNSNQVVTPPSRQNTTDDMSQTSTETTKTKTRSSSSTTTGSTRTDNLRQTAITMNKKYIDIQLQLDPSESMAIKDIMNQLIERLKKWLTSVQDVEASFRLLTINEHAELQTKLHNTDAFPTNMAGIKDFFKGARPRATGGRLYLKVLAEFQGSSEQLLTNVDWFHRARGESFRIATIQAAEVGLAGWLLYSLRHFNLDDWRKYYTRRCGKEIALRWMRIADGTRTYGRSTENDPKAVHIECALADLPEVKKTFYRWYGSKVTSFPRGVKMRYAPPMSALVDLRSIDKFKALRERQHGWSEQCGSINTEAILADKLDKTIPGTDTTLRKWIMSLRAEVTGSIGTLFQSIDLSWRGVGHIISFHPTKAAEASATIKGLYVRAKAEFGDGVERFFSVMARSEGTRMTWDPVTKTLTSEEDDEVRAILSADDEMSVFAATKRQEPAPIGFIAERERDGDDSISTLQSQPKRRKTNHQTNLQNSGNASATSSCSSLTQGTMQTRMTHMETNLQTMQQKQDEQFLKLNDMVASLLTGLTGGQLPQEANPSAGSRANHPRAEGPSAGSTTRDSAPGL